MIIATLKLPFEYEVLAMIKLFGGDFITVVKRNHELHPYCVWRTMPNGSCHYGSYYKTWNEALFDAADRAGIRVEVLDEEQL